MSSYHRRHKSVLYPGSADALALGESPDQCTQGGDLDSYRQGARGAWFENPELARQLQMGNQAAVDHLDKLRSWQHSDESPQPFPDKLGTPDWYDARHHDHLRRHRGNPPPPSYYLEYGKMEQDGQQFRDFAFRTHKQAYLKGGLLDLPTHDLLRIVRAPEFDDIATISGLGQIVATAATVSEDRVGDLFAEPGILPSHEHVRQWSRGDPEAADVPYQTAPELPADAQCRVEP